MPRPIYGLLMAGFLSACGSIPTPTERHAHAEALAAAQGWQAEVVSAGQFDLVAYVPKHTRQDPLLTVYIEGDGFAWINGATPSNDPTPRNPLALRLAVAQPVGNAAYLARPCQFVLAPACRQPYWTESRFAPEVIASMNEGINQLKLRFGAKRLTLVGYSGGAAVAALLTARRQDVERLVTVAGNLDHAAWTTHHRVAPLSGSLNASDDREQLAAVLQTHFVGERDKVIPPSLASMWAEELRGRDNRNLRVQPGFDHTCCWAESWRELSVQAK